MMLLKSHFIFSGKAILTLLFLSLTSFLPAQSQSVRDQTVVVDKNGVMHWGKNGEEVHAFGVNYTAMFAHAYRVARQFNVPLKEAIEDDVYHFARLGFDAFRVHVWDCEISDSVGNLLENEHLDLFDYTLAKMKERGMKFILTPIAYWPNGFPEPPKKTPGFATKYGKDACLTNPEAIKAQEKYLFQFLNHVNVYTGTAYKDDPDIIAFEISNEPHHKGSPEEVTTFINRMSKSMRGTGCKKPIFYNVSHSIHLVDAYFKSAIQGGTFQWYPTGLGARHELGGNLLPNVEKYLIPFANHPDFKQMAKIVYEFDAADVGRSYIYPAMARSFREAGIQIATHFAYDPTYMAHVNTEYSTHYMNLVYAPQKALSLKIASEIFHTVPLYKKFESYPGNTKFDSFHVDYEKDLAEMVTDKKFIYTNHTSTVPPSPKDLEQVAGFGNSHLVKYDGVGAYFIDRLEKGIWRLEVMPDAIWICDPFGRTSLTKEVAVLNWRNWPITIDLPDLGKNFSVKGINDGNKFSYNTSNGSFIISPGSYLLTKNGSITNLKPENKWTNIHLKEFAAPRPTIKKTYVIHKPLEEISVNQSYTVEATIASIEDPESVELVVFGSGFRPEVLAMKKTSGYNYSGVIPGNLIHEGFLRYYISIKEKGNYRTYPSGIEGRPYDWYFYDDAPYSVRAVSKNSPIYLFDALHDTKNLTRQWIRGSTLKPAGSPGSAELHLNIEKLYVGDPENQNGEKIYDYSLRYFFGKEIEGRKDDLAAVTKLVFTGRSLNNKPCKLQLALVTKNGLAYGGIITVGTDKGNYELLLKELKKVKLVSLPRPYPTFLPYYFENHDTPKLNLDDIETLQVSFGPGNSDEELKDHHGIAIQSVRLEP